MSLLACPGFQYFWVGLMLQYLTTKEQTGTSKLIDNEGGIS